MIYMKAVFHEELLFIGQQIAKSSICFAHSISAGFCPIKYADRIKEPVGVGKVTIWHQDLS